MSQKLQPGIMFPELPVKNEKGERVDISKPAGDYYWRMIVTHRGNHCPKCTQYLQSLNCYVPRLLDIGIDVVAVSGDSQDQLKDHLEETGIEFPMYCGLTIEQMTLLGLYISEIAPWKDSDHIFSEPGMFIINAEGRVQIIDICNSPFMRPDLDLLVSGLEWMRQPGVEYPVRGTWEQL